MEDELQYGQAPEDFEFYRDPATENYKMEYKQNLVDLVMSLEQENRSA